MCICIGLYLSILSIEPDTIPPCLYVLFHLKAPPSTVIIVYNQNWIGLAVQLGIRIEMGGENQLEIEE